MSPLNLYVAPKQDRKKMQINLQNGFLTFVRRYCGYDMGTTAVFNIIHDYYFEFKEITPEWFRDKKDQKAYATEGVFLEPNDKERLSAGLLDRHEKIILFQDILKKERIIVGVKLFRQMLIEKEMPLFLEYQSINTINKEISSTELCVIGCNFYELMYNNFESFHKASIRYIEEDLTNAMNLFFKEFNREDPRYQLFRRDDIIDTFFKLYVEHQCLQIFSLYANQHDWSNKGEDDNKVSLYLQRTYGLTSTTVNKFILPSLSKVKDNI